MAVTPRPLQDYFVTAELDDISTASTCYVACPCEGKVVKVMSVIHGAITVADAALTPKINGTNMTGGGITVTQSGSAAGDVDSSEPTAANDAQEGDSLEVTTDGGSTTARRCTITFIVRRG